MSQMPDSYLSYAWRDYGQDHGFYDWQLAHAREPLRWQDGTEVAVCLIVPVEFFSLNPSGAPFKHPGAMATPYPDLRHYTVRDYGNRVGIYRILDTLKKQDCLACFAINGEVTRRYPPLLKAIKTAEHEIIAHSVSTDHIHHEAMTADEERAIIKETLSSFDEPPLGWMSPARNQSSRTPSLLAEAGLTYMLDWEMDQRPVTFATEHGQITAIPNHYELSDFTLLHTRRQTEDSWSQQIKTAITQLKGEYERYGTQMLGLTLTPYIIGQPFRIQALQDLLQHMASLDGVSICTAQHIHDAYQKAQP